MNNTMCSILVLSCDKNSDLMNLFERHFVRYWPDCQYNIYVGLEKENVCFNNWKTLHSDCQQWAQRVKSYLRQIPTDIVLIMLDDFLIEENVSQEKIQEYINKIESDVDLINITLENIPARDNRKLHELHLLQRGNQSNYLVNMQVGLWRKEYLLHLMKDTENPWQTELYSSIRARQYKDKKFYCIDSDKNMPIANGRGWLIVRGCWNQNEIDRLGLQSDPIIMNSRREIKVFERNAVLIPRHKRIPEIIGTRFRKLLSKINVYI